MSLIQSAVAYIAVYLAAAWATDGTAAGFWIRSAGPLLPALLIVAVILRNRHRWYGTQAVFWIVVAAGISIWCIGHLGFVAGSYTASDLPDWLDWHTTFSLVGGGAAPILAFLARPHRGPRPSAVQATTLDIATMSVWFLFMYGFFVLAPNVGESPYFAERSLQVLIVIQRVVLVAVVACSAMAATDTPYARVFRGLTAALAVGLVFRAVLSFQLVQRVIPETQLPQAVLDLAWLIPYFGWAWAASEAPASPRREELVPSSDVPWWPSAVAVVSIPIIGYAVRLASPISTPVDNFRDLLIAFATVVAIVLLSARLASQRTDIRRADARSRLLAAAVEQTESLVMVVRKDGSIEHANAAMLKALGLDREAVANKRFSDTIGTPHEALGQIVEAQARRDGVWRGTFSRRRADGTSFPVAATVVPLMDDAGAVSHFVGVERDITEDLRVRDELVRAERMSAVGELVAGVAHEINNPLQAIVGTTEILSEAVTDPQMKKDVSVIRVEAGRAREIVRSLLSFVHRRPTERVPTDLKEILQEALSLRGYHLKQKGVELTMECACGDPMPRALANPDEIRQLLLNLVLNAEHAVSGAPTPRRIVLSCGEADGGSMVYLQVSDSGPGVPEHLRHRIFEPFFTTKEVGEGTGLGLSISHGIAAAHGGRLELLRVPGGACFRLTLPVAAHATAAAPASLTVTPPEGTPSPVFAAGDRRALVVDDEESVRSLIARLLLRRGYRVVQANDGEQALNLLQHETFDLVLCDVRMPRLSGRALFEAVQAGGRAHVAGRFVLMTGDTLSTDVAAFAEKRGVMLLTKPFTARELDALLG